MTAMIFEESYVTKSQSLLTLMNFLAIVFPFILISTDIWLLFCMMALVLFLFVN